MAYADSQTGKITRIANYGEIIKNWNVHKAGLQKKYGFIRSPQTRENLNKFISLSESQITNEQKLIQELNTKMFFNLFFNKYLVSNRVEAAPYRRTFYSQLFEGFKFDLQFTQDLLSESEDKVRLKDTGVFDKKNYNTAALEKMYNTKFKPSVGYGFSGYDFKYTQDCIIDDKEHWLESAEVAVTEEIKNNIEVFITYNLKKVKL